MNTSSPSSENEEKAFAFVLMPFSKEFDDVYQIGIKETAQSLGILAERVDEQIYREGILERVYRQIDLADIIIADMSGQNPNVFYEVGYAHAKDKLCILLTSCVDDIPFDLKHKRHIVYGKSISHLKAQLYKDITWALDQIAEVKKKKIKVTVQSIWADLDKNKYLARAKLKFRVDLLNETSKSSADIEYVYFYCGKGWELLQDGKIVPSTESDVKPFSYRHFLASPIRRLHKDAWSQLVFEASKTVGYATKGQELKDSYKVSGKAMLRIVTAEGNIDHEFRIDVEADEIPF